MKSAIVALAWGYLLVHAQAQPAGKARSDQVIRELPLKSPIDEDRVTGRLTKITSREQLAKVLHDQSDIAKQVDFTREYLLLFVWEGSDGDTLTFKVEESQEAPIVTFSYEPGDEDDLRPHYHLYLIRGSPELVVKAPLFAQLPWDRKK